MVCSSPASAKRKTQADVRSPNKTKKTKKKNAARAARSKADESVSSTEIESDPEVEAPKMTEQTKARATVKDAAAYEDQPASSKRRSGPRGLSKVDRERDSMLQAELHTVKALLWEANVELHHGPWQRNIEAVRGSSGDFLDMMRAFVDTMDRLRHMYKRKWQLACMLLK